MEQYQNDLQDSCLLWILDAVESLYELRLHERDAAAAPKKKLALKFDDQLTRGSSSGPNASYGVYVICGMLRRQHMPKGTRFPDFCATVAESIAAFCHERAETLGKGATAIERVSSAGPFVQFFCYVADVAKTLLPSILSGEFFTRPSSGVRVMVEYSQPNTHKMFHVGHMRNVALGHSLILLNQYAGHDVVAANYIGDVGAHIAKCLWYYLEFSEKSAPNPYTDIELDVPEGMQKVEWLGSMYSAAVQELAFTTWTAFPYVGYVTARVVSKSPHPQKPNWNVCEVEDGTNQQIVVCGGTGYEVGDVVGYIPVGVRKGGAVVGVVDKLGVDSHGIILGKEELGISVSKKNKSAIHVFPEGTPLGHSLAEIGRRETCPIAADISLDEEMVRRNKGVRDVLTRIEEQDPDMLQLWQTTRKWSLDDFDVIYKWLGAPFDHIFYESTVDQPSKQFAIEMRDQGVFEESHGAVGMDLRRHRLGFAMVLTSAGNGLYLTKDLELAKVKFNDFNIDRSLYVVDSGQSFHFQQVFKVLELLGFEQAKQCEHVAYGLVTLPQGKMSSRHGTVIPFQALKTEIGDCIRDEYFTATSELASNKKRAMIASMSEEEMEEAIRLISVGTIRYGMLNQDPVKNIIFEMDHWVGKKGNTGPYVMYAYTRTSSILRKNAGLGVFPEDEEEEGETQEEEEGETIEVPEVDFEFLPEDTRPVLAKLTKFNGCVNLAVENSKPSVMTNYLFSLCQELSTMYELPSCSVLKAEDVRVRVALLHVYKSLNLVLKNGLGLLGIDVLERM